MSVGEFRDWYVWLWRECFQGETALDRFEARCAVLSIHITALIAILLIFGIAHGR